MNDGTVLTFEQMFSGAITDEFGAWVYTSGNVSRDGRKIGTYQGQRRVTNPPNGPDYGEPITTTLFLGPHPHENITLHGGYTSTASLLGNETGSVIGASAAYQEIIGASYTKTEGQVDIQAYWPEKATV